MDTDTIIGLGLIAIGLIIFIFSLLRNNFRKFAGIKEYKRARNQRFKEEEHKQTEDKEESDGPMMLTSILVIIILLVMGLMASYTLFGGIDSQQNATPLDESQTIQSFETISNIIPLISVAFVIMIVLIFITRLGSL